MTEVFKQQQERTQSQVNEQRIEQERQERLRQENQDKQLNSDPVKGNNINISV